MPRINPSRQVWLVASGDLRLSANLLCWQAQSEMEEQLTRVLINEGCTVKRAHAYDEQKKHGFIDSQKMGIAVFRSIPEDALLIVAESVWQYSHHVLAGLTTHKGPILTVANWSGTWPGLVGMLNLNGSLTKAGVHYSSLWSEDFSDEFFQKGLKEWLNTGAIKQDQSHVTDYALVRIPDEDEKTGREFGAALKNEKVIMGVFDEGCMGMYNAIVPDDLLHATGIFKERLSQSALYARMLTIPDADAEQALQWLLNKGMKFNWGTDEATELTRNQTLDQCKMYIAALQLADDFGCGTIGIQYQQGLKDLTATSDLAEGLLNNTERPPVFADGKELFAGAALPHFNEVDECAGIDGYLTYHLWKKMGLPPENTLHDIRWGQDFNTGNKEEFVWVFLISGAAPAAHFVDGYQGASSERQPAMYFPKGGGSLKGLSRRGHIVWSRVYVMDDQLHCDLGVGEVVALPDAEVKRRWELTTPEWPVMHAVLKGVSRDQMMGRHKANHIQVVYTNGADDVDAACRTKAAAMAELGIKVHFCGDVNFSG